MAKWPGGAGTCRTPWHVILIPFPAGSGHRAKAFTHVERRTNAIQHIRSIDRRPRTELIARPFEMPLPVSFVASSGRPTPAILGQGQVRAN